LGKSVARTLCYSCAIDQSPSLFFTAQIDIGTDAQIAAEVEFLMDQGNA